MRQYENAADAVTARQTEELLMTKLLALQQAVLNSIQSESSVVLQEQKLAWLDIIDTVYEWVEGITSEVPQAAHNLEEWEQKFADITTKTDTAFKQLEDEIEKITNKITLLGPATTTASEAAEESAPSMQTFGGALGDVATNAGNANTELANLPENIQGASEAAQKNPINITASSNISDVLSEINKSIEEYAAPAIKIPIEFILPPTFDIMWHALVSIIGGAVKTVEGLISLSFELGKPKKEVKGQGFQYGGEVLRTGRHLVHRGEYILPKRDLQRLIDALYLMTRREFSEEYSAQRIYNIRIEGEPTPGAARFIRELEYIS